MISQDENDYMWARWKFIAFRNKLKVEFTRAEPERQEEISKIVFEITSVLSENSAVKIRNLAIKLRLSGET